MMYTVKCPHCGQKHKIRKSSLGTIKTCQNCGRKMTLPARGPLSGCVWGLLAVDVLVSGICCLGIRAMSDLGGRLGDAERQQTADTAPAIAMQNPAPTLPQPRPNTTSTPGAPPASADSTAKADPADEARLRAKADAYEAARKKYEAARNEYDSLRKLELARRLEGTPD